MKKVYHRYNVLLLRATKSIWLFPALLTIALLLLTGLRINGSSIGIYHQFLYNSSKDTNLLANKPRAIRSDEWVVNTQMTIAQQNNNFSSINTHLGNGEDMDLIVDAPTDSIWQLFKPHNIVFHILPLEYAFAFKWWFMGYLLILSSYFFVLRFLPNQKLIAALLALAFYFSPFIQWWYQFITIAPIYYGLFIFLTTTRIYSIPPKNRRALLLYTLLLVYLCVCFALVQYPAFQIATIFAVAPLTLAYTGRKNLLSKRSWLIIAGFVLSGVIALTFLYGVRSELANISNSAYPGKRVVTSGGYDYSHLLASNVSPLFQSNTRAAQYTIPTSGAMNQSESSNFIFILPLLIAPLLYLIRKKESPARAYILAIITTFALLSLWMVVPHLDGIGKILLLDKIPLQRLLIAFGILNLAAITILLRYWVYPVANKIALGLYIAVIFAVSVIVTLSIHLRFPLFIGIKLSLLLSIVYPLLACLLLLGYKQLFAAGLLTFTVASTIFVNPLYQGLSVVTKNPLSSSIHELNSQNPGRWAFEDSSFENFALMEGADTLTGVFSYPQVGYWRSLAPSNTNSDIYNRYAHVGINFDRHGDVRPTKFVSPTPDHFSIYTEPCGDFTKKVSLRYLVTSVEISSSSNPCLHLLKRLPLTGGYVIIYSIDQ